MAPHLAADAALDADALGKALAAIQPLAADEDMIDKEDGAKDEGNESEPKAKTAEDEEEKKEDEEEDKDGKKPAMDAATVKKMIAAAEARGAARVAAIELAKRDVAPLVGEVIGMDSAAAVYAFALESVGIERAAIDGAPVTTLKAMVQREADRTRSKSMTFDAAAVKRANDSFAELYGSN